MVELVIEEITKLSYESIVESLIAILFLDKSIFDSPNG
jgi:hypothetical protein